MSELASSQSQKALSSAGLLSENTVIDRKGRIRKVKPPVPIKPRALSGEPLILRDFHSQRQEIQRQNEGGWKTQSNLNARNILELNANKTKNVQRDSQRTGEVLDNEVNRLGCTEPIWKERPGARQISNAVTSNQGVATTDEGVAHEKLGVAIQQLDIITDVDSYKEVLIKSAQLKFKVQKIRKHKIDRIEDGIASAAAASSADDVDATGRPLYQHAIQEPNHNVYELALETLEDEDDDDDEDDDEEEEEEDGCGLCRRSESPDTLVERILENMDEDGVVVDFDGEAVPEKPPRRKLYSREKSFSDEILERFGETAQGSPTVRNLRPDERSIPSSSSTKRNGMDDGGAVWVQANEPQRVDKAPPLSELSSAAAAAVIRLDRYIIDQQSIDEVEPKIEYAEGERRDAEPKGTLEEPMIKHDDPKLNHVDSKIRGAKPKVSQAKPKISQAKPKTSHAENNNLSSESTFVTSAALPSDVANKPIVDDTQSYSKSSQASKQPSETALHLADNRRSHVRERSPEEIFEEIVESMRDTEGDYEEPFPLDWPEFLLTPGKSPEIPRVLRTGGVPVDYSIQNDWLSFFYCNRINAASGESAAATPPPRRSSQENRPQMAPNSSGPAAESVGVFLNASLSASTSWMSRPIRGDCPSSGLSNNHTTASSRSDEKGDVSEVLKQPEEATTQNHQPGLILGPTSGLLGSNLPAASVQSSTETLLDFARDDPIDQQISTAVDTQSPDTFRSVLQMNSNRTPDTDSESRAMTKELIEKSNTASVPLENPEIVSPVAVQNSAECIAGLKYYSTDYHATVADTENDSDSISKPKCYPVVSSEIVNVTATAKSAESISRLKSLPNEKPDEVFILNRTTQLDVAVTENPTELLFAALDAAFVRNSAPTDIKTSTEKYIESDDDTDDTMTPRDDASHSVIVLNHRDAAAVTTNHPLNPDLEPGDTANDRTGSADCVMEYEKVNEARPEEYLCLDRSIEKSRQLEILTESTRCHVEPAAEEADKLLSARELADPSSIEEVFGVKMESKRGADSQHTDSEGSATIDENIPDTFAVAEVEQTSAEPSDDVANPETDDIQQTVASCTSVDPITVCQPHPPKRVVKVLSDEVTTQTVLLKIAWPAARLRERSRDRAEQPFRELQLRRTIRMTEPVDEAPHIGRQNTPTIPVPFLSNQPHSASTSGDPINDETVQSHEAFVSNSNPVNSNGIVNNSDGVSSNGNVNSNGVLATESSPSPARSSTAARSDFVVEYENEEQSHNTEVTHGHATVDVTQTDSVKVLLVPTETVYKVQDLKEIVAAVGRTILNDSRRLPVESNIRVTCEAVQSKSCASVQDRDVTVIRNTILDTYNSTNDPTIKQSAAAAE